MSKFEKSKTWVSIFSQIKASISMKFSLLTQPVGLLKLMILLLLLLLLLQQRKFYSGEITADMI